MATTKDTPLTGKQPAFVDHYVACGFNATEAAARAGYKGNRRTLAAIGSENLAKPHIRAAIKERMEESAMKRDEALYRLAQLARASFEAFLTFPDDGSEPYIDLHKAKQLGALGLIKDYKQTETVLKHNGKTGETIIRRETRVTLHDSMRALFRILDETQPPAPGSVENPVHHKHTYMNADSLARLAEQAHDELDEWNALRLTNTGTAVQTGTNGSNGAASGHSHHGIGDDQ